MKHRIFTVIAFTLVAACTASAAPRKVRALNFPRNDDLASQPDITLQQDAVAQEDREAAEAIRLESEAGPSLIERQRGETYTEYKDRLEAARERLKNAPPAADTEELRKAQMEAIYEAEYQLRKDPFGGNAAANMYGQGAGPWGMRDEPPLELQRVIKLLESQSEETAGGDAQTSPKKTTIVLESAIAPEQEREEGSDVTP